MTGNFRNVLFSPLLKEDVKSNENGVPCWVNFADAKCGTEYQKSLKLYFDYNLIKVFRTKIS